MKTKKFFTIKTSTGSVFKVRLANDKNTLRGETMKTKQSAHTPGVSKGNVPWNAGTGKGWTDRRGYHWIRIKGRSVREHRHLMEQHLGRKITAAEIVHHKNGNTADNRIDNLELMANGEHMRVHHIGVKRPDMTKLRIKRAARDREIINCLLRAAENARNVLAGLATGDLKEIKRDSSALIMLRAAITKAEGGGIV